MLRRGSLIPLNSVKITESTLLNRSILRDIFQTSIDFYCFDQTEMALEASLCGCNVVFLNEKIIINGDHRFLDDTSRRFPDEIEYSVFADAYARTGEISAILDSYSQNVLDRIETFAKNLREKILLIGYEQKIRLPYSIQNIFVQPVGESGNIVIGWKPFRIRDKKLNKIQTDKTSEIPISFRNKIRLVVIDWLLPPRFTYIVISLRNVFLKRS